MNNYQNQNQPNPYQPVPNSPYNNQPPQNNGYSQPYNQPYVNNNQNDPMGQNNFNQPNTFMNPGFFRGSVPNQQLIHQNNPEKLSEDEHYYSGTLTQNARSSFVAKVYMMLSLQLLFTTVVGYIGYNSPVFKSIFINPAALIILSVSLIAVSITISCCTDFFRRYALPIFVIFTVLMSILVAISICAYQSKVVLTAVVITLVLTIGLTIYAWKTDSDLTGCGVYLMIIGLVLFIFGIISIFWNNPIVQLVYSCLAAFLFAIYLVFDTQLVLGQKQYSYSLDDSIIAALQLYMDIINLFLNILRILAAANR